MHASSSPSPSSAGSRENSSSVLDKFGQDLFKKTMIATVYIVKFIENLNSLVLLGTILSTAQLMYFTLSNPLFDKFTYVLFRYTASGMKSLIIPVSKQQLPQLTISQMLYGILGGGVAWFLGFQSLVFLMIKKDEPVSGIVKGVLKVSALTYLLLEPLITVPVAQLLGITLSCSLKPSGIGLSNVVCYNTPNLLDLGMVVILGLPMLYCLLKLKTTFITPDPLSRSPKASFSISREKALFYMKIILPQIEIFFNASPFSNMIRSISILICHLLVLRISWNSPVSSNTIVSLLHSCLDSLQVMCALYLQGLCLSNLMDSSVGATPKSLLYLVIAVIAAICFGIYIEISKTQHLLDKDLFRMDKETHIEEYMYRLIVAIDYIGSSESRNTGAWFALKSVSDRLLAYASTRVQVPQQLLTAAAQLKALQTNYNDSNKLKTKTVDIVLLIMDWILKSHPTKKFHILRIMYSSICCFRRKNPWTSYHIIEGLLCEKELPVNLKACLFYLNEHIEDIILQQDFLQSALTGINITNTLIYMESAHHLEVLIRKNTENYKVLWKLLLGKQPSPPPALHSLAWEICKHHSSIQLVYGSLTNSSTSSTAHLPSLKLYGNYLQYAVNNIDEAIKPLTQANIISQAVAAAGTDKSNTEPRMHADLDTCIFLVSAEEKDLGLICKSHGQTVRYFGYLASDVVGKPIEMFMPRIFADQHPGFMQRVFQTTDMKAIEKIRPIFALDRLGFSIALRLVVRVLPKLNGGLRLVGTFTPPAKDLEQEPVLIVNAKDGNLEGVTYNSYVRYGIHPCICSDAFRRKYFSVLNLFPKITTLAELLEEAGTRAELVIDTSKLQSQEFIPTHHLRDSRLPERQPDAFSSHKVKLSIHARSSYGLDDFDIVFLVIDPLNMGPTTNLEMNLLLDMATQFKTIRPVRSRTKKKEEIAQLEKAEAQSKTSKSSVQKLQRGVKVLTLFGKKGLSRLKEKSEKKPGPNTNFDLQQSGDILDDDENGDESNWEKVKVKREQSKGRNSRIFTVFLLYLINLVFSTCAFFIVYQYQSHRSTLYSSQFSLISATSELQYYLTRCLSSSQNLYIASFRPSAMEQTTNPAIPFSTSQYSQSTSKINVNTAVWEVSNVVSQIVLRYGIIEDSTLKLMQSNSIQLTTLTTYNARHQGQTYAISLDLRDLTLEIVNYLETFMQISSRVTTDSQQTDEYFEEMFYFLQINTFGEIEDELHRKNNKFAALFDRFTSHITWTNISLLICIFIFVFIIEGLSVCFFVPLFQSISCTVVPLAILAEEDLRLLRTRVADFYDEFLRIEVDDSFEISFEESSYHTDSSGASELDKQVEQVEMGKSGNTEAAIKTLFSAFNPQKSNSISKSTSLRSIDLNKVQQTSRNLQYQRSKSFNELDEVSPKFLKQISKSSISDVSKISLVSPQARNKQKFLSNLHVDQTPVPQSFTDLPTNPGKLKPVVLKLMTPAKKQPTQMQIDQPSSPLKESPGSKNEKGLRQNLRRKFKFTTSKIASFHQLNKQKYSLSIKEAATKLESVDEAVQISPEKSPSKTMKRIITKRKTQIISPEQQEHEQIVRKKQLYECKFTQKQLYSSHFLAVIIVVVLLLFPCAAIITFRETGASAVLDTVTGFTKLILDTLNSLECVESSSLRLTLISNDFSKINFDDVNTSVDRINKCVAQIQTSTNKIAMQGIDTLNLPTNIKAALVVYLDLANYPICSDKLLDQLRALSIDANSLVAACQQNPNPDKSLAWFITQVQLIGDKIKQGFFTSGLQSEDHKRMFWMSTAQDRQTLRSLIRIYSRFVRCYIDFINYHMGLYHDNMRTLNFYIFVISSFCAIAAFFYGGVCYLGSLNYRARQSKSILSLIPSDLVQYNHRLQQELKKVYRIL